MQTGGSYMYLYKVCLTVMLVITVPFKLITLHFTNFLSATPAYP